MKQTCMRILSLLLCLTMLLSMTVLAVQKNSGVRHETATALSADAEAYYTGDYSWDNLLLQEGLSTDSSLEAMNSRLYETLHTLMESTQTHSVSYKSLTKYWRDTDTQPGYKDATLFYSDCDGSSYNREHVWPKSRASFQEHNGGCDLHHLRPTDTIINSTRSNYTMGNVRGVLTDYKTKDYEGKTVLYYSPETDLVEVNDNIKGDVARILLYVYVRWEQPNLTENVAGANLPRPDSDDQKNNGLKVMESVDTLLQWCEQDPVDEWEMSRNDSVQTVQGNRNVFIDYPELAWLLFARPLPSDMDTPSGYAKEEQKPAYEITAKSSREDWGTVALSGNKITASPKDGYYAEKATVEPAGAAQIQQEGNVFRVSQLTSNVTVTIHFAPKEKAHISYSLPQSVSAQNAVTESYLGDEVTLPQVEGQEEGYTFQGWVDTPVEKTTDLGDLRVYKPGEAYVLTAKETTLYGLFSMQVSDGTGEANTYRLVTQAPQNWSGNYVLVGTSNAVEYAHLATGNSVGSADGAVALETAGITHTGDTLGEVSGDYVIQIEQCADGTYSMKLAASETPCYLSYTGTKNSLSVSDNNTGADTHWSFTVTGDGVQIQNAGTSNRYLQFNASAKMFRCYTGSQQTPALYAEAGSITTWYQTFSPVCSHVAETRNQKEATCLEPGYTGDVYCKNCGILLEQGKEIPALGHEWSQWEEETAATCLQPGVEERHCTRCNEVETREIPALGHEWSQWEEKTAPGCFHTGEEERRCTHCNEVETREIPANGDHCPSKAFSDLDLSRWYHAGVDYVLEQKFMKGVGNGLFRPNGIMTRGEVVTVLYRMEESPEVTGEHPFQDVEAGRYYEDAVVWAYQEGLVKGVSDTSFAPSTPITREQMVTFLYRYAQYKGQDVSASGDLTSYPDHEQVKPFAKEAMTWAVDKEIIKGIDGALMPRGQSTRAQSATMVQRFAQ